ncbi:MAG: serine/threonine-protein kinase, partial [Chloroflexota bacterium]
MQQQLDHYKIEALLGEGSFARVYRAFDQKLERYVALKILKSVWLDDSTATTRFKREAKIMSRLSHPHIVAIYNVGETQGQIYLAQYLVQGDTLANYLKKQGALSWEKMLEIVHPLAEALAYAHKNSIVHRDVKPSNILLEEGGGVYLSDFGLVKAAEGSVSLSSSSSGGIIGTPHYMAPEQWRDEAVSGATDIYALTCVVLEILTGKPFFAGTNPANVMTKHLVDRPNLPEVWPNEVPDDLNQILQLGIAKNVEDRIGKANDFYRTLIELDERDKRQKQQVVWYNQGLEAFNQGIWEEAVDHFGQLENAQALARFSDVERKLKQARENFRQNEAVDERLRRIETLISKAQTATSQK